MQLTQSHVLSDLYSILRPLALQTVPIFPSRRLAAAATFRKDADGNLAKAVYRALLRAVGRVSSGYFSWSWWCCSPQHGACVCEKMHSHHAENGPTCENMHWRPLRERIAKMCAPPKSYHLRMAHARRREAPEWHPGVLAAKVSDFGSNLLKWARAQMGTKRSVKPYSRPPGPWSAI